MKQWKKSMPASCTLVGWLTCTRRSTTIRMNSMHGRTYERMEKSTQHNNQHRVVHQKFMYRNLELESVALSLHCAFNRAMHIELEVSVRDGNRENRKKNSRHARRESERTGKREPKLREACVYVNAFILMQPLHTQYTNQFSVDSRFLFFLRQLMLLQCFIEFHEFRLSLFFFIFLSCIFVNRRLLCIH